MAGREGWRARLAAHWTRQPPSLLSRLLQPLAALYAALAWCHRQLFTQGWRRSRHPGVPVLVVGNLIAGGAGKTPTVIHLVQALRLRGWTPGVVSRGHGGMARQAVPVTRHSTAAEVGDEPLLIHLRSGAPVVVARRRAEAAEALRRHTPQVDLVVADDGLQHHALARDAQVLVFDERGAGNGLRLPAGPLREALPASVPASSVVLYNAPAPSTPLPGFLARRQLAGAVSLADWWRGAPASEAALLALRGRPIVAAAGLARPEPFFAMLEGRGLTLHRLPLPDHHPFRELPWPSDTVEVIVTEKDAVKLRPEGVGATRVWVATLDFVPDPAFDAAVARLLPPPPNSTRES